MKIKLGMNTQFAVNRFPEPDDWIGVVADKLGLDTVQLTADVLNPFLPDRILDREIEKIRACCDQKKVKIESVFTGGATRVNHMLHPDPDIQRVWIDWFKRLFNVTAALGARGAGSCFGIFAIRDFSEPARREELMARGVEAWRELSYHAAELGLDCVLIEPMSIPRECASTIGDAQELIERCSVDFPAPARFCLDVDHGAIESPDASDTDPHAWIQAFADVTDCIHIKQSLKEKGGHYPFTKDYNARGKIVPREILATMDAAGLECTLFMELSWRERWPTEYSVLSDLKESVEYWRPVIEKVDGKAALQFGA